MKFLIENIDEFEILTEDSKDGKKDHWIKGIFMQAEVKNRNGRLYPRSVMEGALHKYVEEMVSKKRAVGELSHPEVPTINPDRVSHLVTELTFQNNDVIGKAKILNTPCGKILKALIEGGVSFGVSSRALGSLKEESGVKIVQPDLSLSAIDAVMNPSAPMAFVDAIMEEEEWVFNNGEWVKSHLEHSQILVRESSSKDLEKVALNIFKNYINSL
jgi:hypothetical protein